MQIDSMTAPWPRAKPGASTLIRPGLEVAAGLSLDLVHDPVRSVDAAPEHLTWAVIAGIDGQERHRRYRRTVVARRVEPIDLLHVGRGESLVLLEHEIHATEVIGEVPTYQLHLHSKSLSALPPFVARSFRLA